MLQQLLVTCFGERDALALARERLTVWLDWLAPLEGDSPVGDDPGYDDDFQRMREEVNKLSGVDTAQVCQLAEGLLKRHCKDVRVATYYVWARLHQDGESGLADGLELLAGLVQTYGESLLPRRATSRRLALEWLAGSKLTDSLSLYPEVVRADFERALAALALLQHHFADWHDDARPGLQPLVGAMDVRLAQSGGVDAVVPQNAASAAPSSAAGAPPEARKIQSGRDLLDQTRELSQYLRNQQQGYLSGSRLMRVVRWDTVHQLPPQDSAGRTRLVPPRAELRAQLKRLYLQQSWSELLDQVERMFAEGVNHFWIDLQWYACQALNKQGHPFDLWADIAKRDLGMFLERLPGLEKQAFNDGTPFADDATLAWIEQQVSGNQARWEPAAPAQSETHDNDILSLEGEALAQADASGIEAALGWLAGLPGVTTQRDRWLQRLLMARVAEQYGKNEMAIHLLNELDSDPAPSLLAHWEPELAFEVKARLLKLLRLKVQRSESDKVALAGRMDTLLSGLVNIDPARASVLCG
ncbi:type VI secretion system protein TssA [Pectobacterium sp. B1J-3]|uniref:type VI secretion system protein TssA n=1 Tax=Pectobacterium sp. B1J-3 TaxID=3385371 RepID=UPI0039064C33